jgi:cell division protein FtsL
VKSTVVRDFYAGAPARTAGNSQTSVRLVFVAALLLVGLLSWLYVRQTADLASTGYDVAELQDEATQWQMRNDQLRLQVADLSSLDRVDQIASSRLGMGPPDRVVYVVATPIALPTPPTIADAPTATSDNSPLGQLLRHVLPSP